MGLKLYHLKSISRKSVLKLFTQKDGRPLRQRIHEDWSTGMFIMESRSFLELFLSASYIGWPYFNSYYDPSSPTPLTSPATPSQVLISLAKVMAVQNWGVLYYLAALVTILAYLWGNMYARKVASVYTRFLWGGVFVLMYSEGVKGWLLPLCAVVIISEMIRAYRLKKEHQTSMWIV